MNRCYLSDEYLLAEKSGGKLILSAPRFLAFMDAGQTECLIYSSISEERLKETFEELNLDWDGFENIEVTPTPTPQIEFLAECCFECSDRNLLEDDLEEGELQLIVN